MFTDYYIPTQDTETLILILVVLFIFSHSVQENLQQAQLARVIKRRASSGLWEETLQLHKDPAILPFKEPTRKVQQLWKNY